ncbi:MAG: hypothetical protein O9252_03955, partial [Algoriphagus sp.]|nr:hypothetical protein [Algoriphagus sp.]
MKQRILLTVFVFFGIISSLFAQHPIRDLLLDSTYRVLTVQVGDRKIGLNNSTPLISYALGEERFSSTSPSPRIRLTMEKVNRTDGELEWILTFTNTSRDTIQLHNVYPFSTEKTEALITGLGRHSLSRTHLFLPNRIPVNVIVPDNSWELGYAAIPLFENNKLAAL